MTNHWVFNTAAPSTTVSAVVNDKVRIGITSTERHLAFKENDAYIVMDKVQGHLNFLYYGKVVGVDDPSLLPSDNEKKSKSKKPKFLHNVELNISSFLPTPRPLKDVAFSLTTVYRYINPEKQFSHQYRSISKDDFDTIAKGWVYVARTAFGKIANALPRENKFEFALLAMDKWRTIDFRIIPFMEGLIFLLDYVHSNIINQGKLLIETDNLLRKNFSNKLDVDKIGIVARGHESMAPNVISKQAKLFKTLVELDERIAIIDQIRSGIQENIEIERRFHGLFKNATWPIDLDK